MITCGTHSPFNTSQDFVTTKKTKARIIWQSCPGSCASLGRVSRGHVSVWNVSALELGQHCTCQQQEERVPWKGSPGSRLVFIKPTSPCVIRGELPPASGAEGVCCGHVTRAALLRKGRVRRQLTGTSQEWIKEKGEMLGLKSTHFIQLK